MTEAQEEAERRGGTEGAGGCGKREEEAKKMSNEAGSWEQARKEREAGGAAHRGCG